MCQKTANKLIDKYKVAGGEPKSENEPTSSKDNQRHILCSHHHELAPHLNDLTQTFPPDSFAYHTHIKCNLKSSNRTICSFYFLIGLVIL